MVAILRDAPHTQPRPSGSDRAPIAVRPQLRVIEGGARRPSAAVYRRRRIVVGVLATVVSLALLFAGFHLLDTSPGVPDPSSVVRPPAPAGVVAGPVAVVQPGDTLWSIAGRVPHHGDIRAVVDKLARAHGEAPLQPGERIPLAGVVG